jgi:hypothetical protein
MPNSNFQDAENFELGVRDLIVIWCLDVEASFGSLPL